MGKAAVLLLLPQLALSLRPAGWLSHPCSRSSSSTPLRSTTRRAAAQSALFAAAAAATSLQLPARAHASIEPGLSLDDLPSKAVQAYRQYWPAMQLAGRALLLYLNHAAVAKQRGQLRRPGRRE